MYVVSKKISYLYTRFLRHSYPQLFLPTQGPRTPVETTSHNYQEILSGLIAAVGITEYAVEVGSVVSTCLLDRHLPYRWLEYCQRVTHLNKSYRYHQS